MATCGNCKAVGQTVEHIRGCYEQKHSTIVREPVAVVGFAKNYVETRDFRPMALTLPDSKYALEINGVVSFYEVRTGKDKWAHMQFVDQLIGAPGDWRRVPMKKLQKSSIMNLIDLDPKAAAIRFSKEFTICAVCSSPLSDPESVALGLGPICAKRF